MFSLKLSKQKKITLAVILLAIILIVVVTPFSDNGKKSELPVDENISVFLSNLKDGSINKLDIKDTSLKVEDDNYANEQLFMRGIKLMCKTSIKKIEITDRNNKIYNIIVSGIKLRNIEPKNLENNILGVKKDFQDGKISEEEVRGKLIDCICDNYNVEETDEEFSFNFELKVNESGEIINKMTLINNLLEETGSVTSMTEYQNYYGTVYEKIRKELGS